MNGKNCYWQTEKSSFYASRICRFAKLVGGGSGAIDRRGTGKVKNAAFIYLLRERNFLREVLLCGSGVFAKGFANKFALQKAPVFNTWRACRQAIVVI